MRTLLLFITLSVLGISSFGQKAEEQNLTEYEKYRKNAFQGIPAEPRTAGDHMIQAADNLMYATIFAGVAACAGVLSNTTEIEEAKKIARWYTVGGTVVSATLIFRATYHFKQAGRKTNVKEL